MSPRTWLERIQDILQCAHNILDFTAGMTFETFLNIPQTIRAVAFEFTTIDCGIRKNCQIEGSESRRSATGGKRRQQSGSADEAGAPMKLASQKSWRR